MRRITIGGDAWSVAIPAGNLHQTFSLDSGEVLLMIGEVTPQNPAFRMTAQDNFIVIPSGVPLYARAVAGPVVAAIGDFGAIGFTPAPAPPPPTEAVVTNGQTLNLLPASGTTPAQGTVAAAVANSALSLRLAANRVALTSGVSLPVQNSAGATIGAGTVTISGNAVQHVRMAGNVAGILSGDTTLVSGQTLTLTVALGALTGGTFPANVAVVPNATAVTVGGVSGSIAVSNRAVTGVTLPATASVVTNGQTFTVEGGTVTISVASGVATATFTPTP